MAERRQPRVLGAVRSLADALGDATRRSDETRRITESVVGGTSHRTLSLAQLEQALGQFTNRNSNYTNVLIDDYQTLVEEVLDNVIRAVLVYDDFSGAFGDVEVCSLSMAFQYNVSVEAVTLSGIDIGDESICMLCEALVRSRVNFLDLSNTPLEDEAGRSLAALAHVNPYLRTVIVDDTLIADDVLDEIDVACQFNQSNYEGSGGQTDESLFREDDLVWRKRRLWRVIRARARNVHYCVAHLFGCCPNGELCLYCHTFYAEQDDVEAGVTPVEEEARHSRLSEKIAEIFAIGGNWEEKLPPRPQEGASWRPPEEQGGGVPRLNLQRRRELRQRRQEQARHADDALQARRTQAARRERVVGVGSALLIAMAGLGAFVAAASTAWWVIRHNRHTHA